MRWFRLMAFLSMGCTPNPEPPRSIDLQWVPDQHLLIDGDHATLTFPLTRRYATTPYVVSIDNVGSQPIGFEAADGGDVFGWQPIHNVTVVPGAALRIEASFTPFTDAPEGELVVVARDGAQTRAMSLSLRGEVDVPNCTLPTAIDGGTVRVGSITKHVIHLDNVDRTPSTPSLETQTNGLSVTPTTARIEAGQGADFTVTWAPFTEGPFQGELQGVASAECGGRVIRFSGLVLPQALRWEPRDIRCGDVSVNGSSSHQVLFTNESAKPVHLSAIRTVAPFSVTPSELTIEPEAQGSIVVTCSPTALGGRSGSVQFVSDFVLNSEGAIPLTVSGVP